MRGMFGMHPSMQLEEQSLFHSRRHKLAYQSLLVEWRGLGASPVIMAVVMTWSARWGSHRWTGTAVVGEGDRRRRYALMSLLD